MHPELQPRTGAGGSRGSAPRAGQGCLFRVPKRVWSRGQLCSTCCARRQRQGRRMRCRGHSWSCRRCLSGSSRASAEAGVGKRSGFPDPDAAVAQWKFCPFCEFSSQPALPRCLAQAAALSSPEIVRKEHPWHGNEAAEAGPLSAAPGGRSPRGSRVTRRDRSALNASSRDFLKHSQVHPPPPATTARRGPEQPSRAPNPTELPTRGRSRKGTYCAQLGLILLPAPGTSRALPTDRQLKYCQRIGVCQRSC